MRRDRSFHFTYSSHCLLQVTSTAEEWERTGRALFENKNYRQAAICFDRIGLVFEESVATAYRLRQQARAIVGKGTSAAAARREAHRIAAKRFEACSKNTPSVKDRKTYLVTAARCFLEADDWARPRRVLVATIEAYLEGQHVLTLEDSRYRQRRRVKTPLRRVP